MSALSLRALAVGRRRQLESFGGYDIPRKVSHNVSSNGSPMARKTF